MAMARVVAILLAAGLLGAEIIDRIVVTVGHEVITEAQLNEELRVTAFINGAPMDNSAASQRQAAERLVEQALVRREMELSRYPLPKPDDVEAYRAEIVKRYGSEDAFRAAMRRYELNTGVVDAHLLLQLTMLRFLDYRFLPEVDVSSRDVEDAYQVQIEEWKRSHMGTPPPLASLRESLQKQIYEARINSALTAKFSPGHAASFIKLDYPVAWLDQDAFTAVHLKERDAEAAVGEAMMKQPELVRDYYTKSQLAQGEVPANVFGKRFLNSYSPEGGWYVLGVPGIYTVGSSRGTDHASPYTYDTHVPLAFYGLPFRPGTYRTHAEPVDLAVTLASLLGINAPTHAVGRVLTEALAPPHHAEEAAEFPKAGPDKAGVPKAGRDKAGVPKAGVPKEGAPQ